MRITLSINCILASVLVTFFVASAIAAPPERTMTMDPIELIAGREVSGKPEFSIEHEGVEYHFATTENKAAFVKEPAKYEVADGGACGRMGPLSGLGDARRYAVYDNRIYFFASDGCREGFLKEPAKYIEADDPMPFGSHEKVLQGRAALNKLVAWAGGVERIRKLSTYRAWVARKEKQGEKEWAVTNETVISFPNQYFQKEAWNESWFSTVSNSEGGAMGSRRGHERIASSRRRAFNRTLAHWPIVIIKAYVDGGPKTECPGFVVIGDGEGKLDGTSVEFVKVWFNGSGSRLTIDKASGRLLQLAFHGRDSTMRVGDSVRRFTKYSTVDGITLPTDYTVTFDGKDLANADAKNYGFEINPKLPADMFKITQ